MSLADRLRTVRLRRGLSQVDLGARLGVAQSAVSAWETGRTPGVEQIRSLAAALDVPILELIDGTPRLSGRHLHAELRWYGLDVHAGPEPVWAVRGLEEVLVEGLLGEDSRVLDRLPALFFLHPSLSPALLAAHAEEQRIGRRLGWLLDLARSLARLGVAPTTRALRECDLQRFLPGDGDPWDSIGHPAETRERLPRAWRRWRIDYATPLRRVDMLTRDLLEANRDRSAR